MNTAKEIVAILTKRKLKIAVAESLTGGALCAAIVSVSGASAVIDEAMVTYSNAAKIARLGVLQSTLNTHGAVSAECVAEMAVGMAKTAGANIGIATTGIAGPNGATEEKPVGLVYIGICNNNKITTHKFDFEGCRSDVITQTTTAALNILRKELEVQ
ncbi:MAG: CinA family protein [Defluviitaleaceae bacterium]|nr:CinA family protein [Defluviitaleaceae bacterium]